MDKLMDTWRASRQKLKDELASIEAKANGKKGLTIGEADEHTELDNAVTRIGGSAIAHRTAGRSYRREAGFPAMLRGPKDRVRYRHEQPADRDPVYAWRPRDLAAPCHPRQACSRRSRSGAEVSRSKCTGCGRYELKL